LPRYLPARQQKRLCRSQRADSAMAATDPGVTGRLPPPRVCPPGRSADSGGPHDPAAGKGRWLWTHTS